MLREQTRKLPKGSSDRLAMLELQVDLVLTDSSIAQKTIMPRCPEPHRLVTHSILLFFIALHYPSNDGHHVESFVLL
jgi:hypothetical protein